jgi:hypothetical protein
MARLGTKRRKRRERHAKTKDRIEARRHQRETWLDTKDIRRALSETDFYSGADVSRCSRSCMAGDTEVKCIR